MLSGKNRVGWGSVLLLWMSLLSLAALAATDCPEQPLRVERLPNLNVPRSSHILLCLDGQLTVAGGHAPGFVPTPTAEYFDGEKWQIVPMAYTHDSGFGIATTTGQVIVSGGAEQALGIGQTFTGNTQLGLAATSWQRTTRKYKRKAVISFAFPSFLVTLPPNSPNMITNIQ